MLVFGGVYHTILVANDFLLLKQRPGRWSLDVTWVVGSCRFPPGTGTWWMFLPSAFGTPNMLFSWKSSARGCFLELQILAMEMSKCVFIDKQSFGYCRFLDDFWMYI